jgi:hypothetical protein
MFSEPTKVRFIPRYTPKSVVQVGARTYEVGMTAVLPAATAEALVRDGYAEKV